MSTPAARTAPIHPSDTSASGLRAGLGAILCWCFTGVCAAEGSRAVGPMVFTSLTAAIGAATSIVLCRIRGLPLRQLTAMPARVWIAGFFGIAVYSVLLTFALGTARDSDVAQVALVNYLWPAILVVAGHFVLKERLNYGLSSAAVALGVAGVIVARGADTFRHPPAVILPHLMSFAAALLWALYSVLLRAWRVPEGRSVAAGEFALCAVLAAGLAVVRGEWAALRPMSASSLFWIVATGIGPVGLAYSWWELGMKRGPAQLIGTLSFFIPVGSTLILGIAFRQSFSPWLIPGALLIVLAAYLSNRAAPPRTADSVRAS